MKLFEYTITIGIKAPDDLDLEDIHAVYDYQSLVSSRIDTAIFSVDDVTVLGIDDTKEDAYVTIETDQRPRYENENPYRSWDEDDEPDINDDFPMSLEYEQLQGVPDALVEQAAAEEASYEAEALGERES